MAPDSEPTICFICSKESDDPKDCVECNEDVCPDCREETEDGTRCVDCMEE